MQQYASLENSVDGRLSLKISSQAPGKLVLTGDYAVLLRSPALVLAVDSVAQASIQTPSSRGWTIHSNILPSRKFDDLDSAINEPENALFRELVNALPSTDGLPSHASLSFDTRKFFQNGQKLGIGSSAAILVATAELISHLTGHHYSLASLIDIHNSIQGNRGSGLDVAAARLGGLIRFQSGNAERTNLPSGLHMSFLFTETSTSTQNMVHRFFEIIGDYPENALETWRSLAESVADAVSDTQVWLGHLQRLNQFVLDFDHTTKLGIYSARHLAALDIANTVGVLYKPCGAGGGDVGIALSDDRVKLDEFERIADHENLSLLNLGVAQDGASVKL